MADPPALPATEPFATRRLALRAIMDGRGLDAVILSSPRSLAHYGGASPERGLLVVTARHAWLVSTGRRREDWLCAAALVPRRCALGHDDPAPEVLGQAARPRRMLCISAEVARQIAACG